MPQSLLPPPPEVYLAASQTEDTLESLHSRLQKETTHKLQEVVTRVSEFQAMFAKINLIGKGLMRDYGYKIQSWTLLVFSSSPRETTCVWMVSHFALTCCGPPARLLTPPRL